MPRETFGGDDDEGGGEETKKLDLSRFDLPPDTNIRDVFWKIMASYAAARKPGLELSTLEKDRFALMRIALSALSRPHVEQHGLPPKFMARYSLMMMLDGGWDDALMHFLEKAVEPRLKEEVMPALKSIVKQDRYKEQLFRHFAKMLRKNETVETALLYLADVGTAEAVGIMKKELIILARGDVGENQYNAIRLISLLKDDEDVKKSLIVLLSHWDGGARLAAAEALVGMKEDAVKKAAAARLKNETVPEIRKALGRIAK